LTEHAPFGGVEMTIDVGLVRLATIFLPGIVGRTVSVRMRATKARAVWEDLLEIMLVAFISYTIAAALLFAIDMHPIQNAPSADTQTTEEATQSTEGRARSLLPRNISAAISNEPIDWTEVLLAMAVALVIGPIGAVFENYKVVNRIGRWLRITKSFGDDDVWTYLNNSPDVDWVFVRDYKRAITYYGHIKAFSDSYKTRELILIDVRVYSNKDGSEMDSLPAVYLSFPDNDMTIEVPQLVSSVPSTIDRSRMKELAENANSEQKRALRSAYVETKDGPYTARSKVGMKDSIRIQSTINRLNQTRKEEGGKDEQR
jgi:hypothetical protein